MMVYWKKYDKVEKEHRKRAEKEAMEQRKLDDELVEVCIQRMFLSSRFYSFTIIVKIIFLKLITKKN